MNVMSAAITSAPDADEAPGAASGATPLEPVAAVSGASFSIFQKRPLRIGIITLWETPETTLALENTLKTIQRIFAPYPVEVDPRILSKDLEARIASGSIDVFIASSGFCLRMNRYGVVPLATLITTRQPDPNNGIGTTYLVRSDDDRFHKIDDLKGTRLSASYDTAFMSYRTGLGEIAVRGYDPEHFFSDIHFSGDSDNLPIAERLDKGLADVAMVRACWLEGQPESVRRRYRAQPGAERADGEIRKGGCLRAALEPHHARARAASRLHSLLLRVLQGPARGRRLGSLRARAMPRRH